MVPSFWILETIFLCWDASLELENVSWRDAFCHMVAVLPVREAQWAQQEEKTGQKTVVEGELECQLATLAGCQPPSQEKTFPSTILQK